MDLLFGRFADHGIHEFSEDELEVLEKLVDVNDQTLFSWICGGVEPPQQYKSSVLNAFRAFHEKGAISDRGQGSV